MALHYNASKDGADSLKREIEGQGGRAACFQADLGDPRAARALAGRVAGELGQLDVLVNSAAVMHHVSFEDTTPELYDEVLDLNLRSVFFVSQGAAPFLRKAGGKIVNLSDLGGLEPWPGYAATLSARPASSCSPASSRGAWHRRSRSTRSPPAPCSCRTIFSGRARPARETTPLQRLGQPEDAVQALLFLLERADFVTGDILVVDGGRVLR